MDEAGVTGLVTDEEADDDEEDGWNVWNCVVVNSSRRKQHRGQLSLSD
jgi:hypothetical protein